MISKSISILKLSQIETYLDHLARHLPETGVGGIVMAPFPPGEPINKDKFRTRILDRWAGTPGIGSWEVAWGIFDGDRIIGHLELIGHSMQAFRHRVKLGMGLEDGYRGQGFGKKLLETAISWAADQDFLQWIDLDVFSQNTVAIKLYKSFGFTPVGLTIDRCRVNGESIDDWHLVLDLKNRRA